MIRLVSLGILYHSVLGCDDNFVMRPRSHTSSERNRSGARTTWHRTLSARKGLRKGEWECTVNGHSLVMVAESRSEQIRVYQREPGVPNVEIEMWNGKVKGDGGAWSWRIEFGGGGDGPSGTRNYRVFGGSVDIFQIFSQP